MKQHSIRYLTLCGRSHTFVVLHTRAQGYYNYIYIIIRHEQCFYIIYYTGIHVHAKVTNRKITLANHRQMTDRSSSHDGWWHSDSPAQQQKQTHTDIQICTYTHSHLGHHSWSSFPFQTEHFIAGTLNTVQCVENNSMKFSLVDWTDPRPQNLSFEPEEGLRHDSIYWAQKNLAPNFINNIVSQQTNTQGKFYEPFDADGNDKL